MLVWVRKLLENWVARGFFALLIVVFVFWGISNVLTMLGSDTAVAHMGGQPVDITQVQAAYQQALNQAEQSGQGQPDLPTRQGLAQQALAGVLSKAVLRQEEASLGVSEPAFAVREALNAIPQFLTNGVFDQSKFEQVLAQNSSSPDNFIGEVHDNLIGRQVLYPVMAGALAPAPLINALFAYEFEQRGAQLVSFADAAEPAPAAPGDDVLRRYWVNHPAAFTAPPYRHVKIVVLSPALLAPSESVAESDIDAGVVRARAALPPSSPKRSADVLLVQDLADSSRLEVAWKRGASWKKIQALAESFNATVLPVADATPSQIADTALSQALFKAQPGTVVGPVAAAAGMYVFKVTKAGQSGPDAAALHTQVVQQLQLQKAQNDVAQDVDGLQDALAGQTPLDQLPGTLGVVAVQGTLDANGNAQDGTAAPIPGGDDVKAAILKAAFAANQGDPAQLENGPNGSYYALSVDQIVPPALRPYDQVKDKVLAAWTLDAQARAAQARAATLTHDVQAGQSLAQAAAQVGGKVTALPVFSRAVQAAGVDARTAAVVFSLKPGGARMESTADGFAVVVLSSVTPPDPVQNAAGYAQLRGKLDQDLRNDASWSFLSSLQTRDNVNVNEKLLAQIYQ